MPVLLRFLEAVRFHREIADVLMFGDTFLERRFEAAAPTATGQVNRDHFREMAAPFLDSAILVIRHFALIAEFNRAGLPDVELVGMATGNVDLLSRRRLEIEERALCEIPRPSEFLSRKRIRLERLLGSGEFETFDREWRDLMLRFGYRLEMAAYCMDEGLVSMRAFNANVYRLRAEYQTSIVPSVDCDRRRCLDVLGALATAPRTGPRERLPERWAMDDLASDFRELRGLAPEERLPWSKNAPDYGAWGRFAGRAFEIAGMNRPGWRLIKEFSAPT